MTLTNRLAMEAKGDFRRFQLLIVQKTENDQDMAGVLESL